MSRRQWTKAVRRTGHALPENEKRAIGQACEALIENVLKPRYVPEVRPSQEFNYAIGIYGKWHGNKYRLIQRYRSDHEDAIAPEFDWPFARLEYVGRDRFDSPAARRRRSMFAAWLGESWSSDPGSTGVIRGGFCSIRARAPTSFRLESPRRRGSIRSARASTVDWAKASRRRCTRPGD